MSPRFRAPPWRKLLLSLLVLVASVVLAELGLRLWLRMQGRPYSAWRTKQEIERAVGTTQAFVPKDPTDTPRSKGGPVLHPYAGVELWHDTGGVLLYYREKARADHFKVLVVGGSVGASFAYTLQENMPELLRDAPALQGKRVTVQNYAHATYKQPQQVTRLAYLLSLGYRPDVVINIDGFNEVALGFENGKTGVNPMYPSPPVWGALANDFGMDIVRDADVVSGMLALRARAKEIAAQADRWHLYESSWLGRWTLARLSAINGEFLAQQKELLAFVPGQGSRMRRQLNGPDYDATDDVMMQTCVRCWIEGSWSLQDLCASRGIRYVHVLQPTLHDAGAKPMDAAEKALPMPSEWWLVGARDGYPLLRARAGELRAHGIRFIDSSRVFSDVQEHLYFDACHFWPEGERIWYERLAPALREAIVGP